MDLLLLLAAGLIVVVALAIGEAEAADRSHPFEVMPPEREERLRRVGRFPDAE
jgi:hypothetical protein